MAIHHAKRSDEIQEIIGSAPSWLLRAGASYVLLVTIILLFLSSVVRYPDVLPASIIITSDPAPSTEVTHVNGSLQLFTHEDQIVHVGQVLGYVKDATSYTDIQALRNLLTDTIQNHIRLEKIKLKQLGSLQVPYDLFLKAAASYQLFRLSDEYERQIQALSYEVIAYERLNNNYLEQQQLQLQEMGLVGKRYTIDSELLRSKVIAQTDADASQRLMLQQERSVSNSKASIITNGITASELRRRIIELKSQRSQREQQLQLDQEQAERSLRNAFTEWQEAHMLVAKRAGKVTLLKEWITGQFIPVSTPILSVLSPTTNLIGRLRLPVQGSGKVKSGQRVNIRLDNYPAEQYGMLEGKVIRLAPLPQGNTYSVEVKLASRLMTTYHQRIPFKQQMQGQAEIVTEDLSLLQRVFYQFRVLWQ